MAPPVILVVDDSAVMRQLTQSVLQEAGYRVLLAEDGPAALALAKARGGAIDLVLTDWTMAPMDGGELTRQLRQLAGYVHLPILVMSTLSHQNVKDEARNSGASGWLSKPVEPASLLAAMSKVMHHSSA